QLVSNSICDLRTKPLDYATGNGVHIHTSGLQLIDLAVELLDHAVADCSPRRAVHHRIPEVRPVLVSGNPGRLRTRSQENVVELSNTLVDVIHPALNRLLVPSPVSEAVVECHFLDTSRSLKPLVHVFGHATPLDIHVEAVRVDLAIRCPFLVANTAVGAKSERFQQRRCPSPIGVQLDGGPRVPWSTGVLSFDTDQVAVPVVGADSGVRTCPCVIRQSS